MVSTEPLTEVTRGGSTAFSVNSTEGLGFSVVVVAPEGVKTWLIIPSGMSSLTGDNTSELGVSISSTQALTQNKVNEKIQHIIIIEKYKYRRNVKH